MQLLTISLHVLAGWCFWSLAHNLGHRWWHVDMKKGKQTFYAHGEAQHHRLYDAGKRPLATAEDPNELFISFPFKYVAPAALLPVAIYGWLMGWSAMVPFAVGLHGSMTLDHLVHMRCHRGRLSGVLGWFQQMHAVHHATHANNYFFVSGLVWDVLFRTAVLKPRQPAGLQATDELGVLIPPPSAHGLQSGR